MKNHLLSIAFPFSLLPFNSFEKALFHPHIEKAPTAFVAIDNLTTLYNEMDLASLGLSKQAFDYAYKGYQHLRDRKKLSNPAILTICDFSQPSDKKRLYILDLCENKVVLTTYVAHGRGSGVKYATSFSNNSRSHQSSLGFYVTGSSYYGQHGIGLRLTGLEVGFNSLATRRHIVMHGAGYVGEEYLQTNQFMGRSYGCPAVPKDECEKIISLLKDGTCLFIYHPTKKYLKSSKILND